MIRLTVISQTSEEAVLKIEGRVAGAVVEILEQEGARLLRESERLVLDLENVRFIDRACIALLKRWSGEHLALRGASPFVRTRLAEHGVETHDTGQTGGQGSR